MKIAIFPVYFPSNLQCLLNMKRLVFEQSRTLLFLEHFSFPSDKNFQTVGQLSSNISEDFAKTVTYLRKSRDINKSAIPTSFGNIWTICTLMTKRETNFKVGSFGPSSRSMQVFLPIFFFLVGRLGPSSDSHFIQLG